MADSLATGALMTVQSRNALAPVPRDVRAVVLATDGLITDSARVLAAARRTTFGDFLHELALRTERRRPFATRDGYPRYVDGTFRPDRPSQPARTSRGRTVLGEDPGAPRDQLTTAQRW